MPGKFNDAKDVRFNWSYADLTQKELLIQLDFDNSNYISTSTLNPDSIRMSIFGVNFFEDSHKNYISQPIVLDTRAIPP